MVATEARRISTTQSGRQSVVVEYESDGCVLGTLGNVVVTVWTRTPRPEHLARVSKCFERVAYDYGHGSGVSIVVSRPGIPSRATRERMAALAREYAPRTIGSAVVLSGEGFWATGLRTFATCLYHVGSIRSRYRHRMCESLHDAATWLAPVHNARAEQPIDAEDLERALTFMRDRALAVRMQLEPRRYW